MLAEPFTYKPGCELKEGIALPEGVHRFALAVEYNGAAFRGFQKQKTAPNTVQVALEEALSKVAAEPITVVCAGRTDAGVHATQQIVHFDSGAARPEKAWLAGTNTHLPNTVRVRWCQRVSGHFHARFSACSRTYRYVLYCDDVRPALMIDQVTWCRYELDVGLMQQAARQLVGEHDFTSFRAAQCQAKNPVRTIEYLKIQPRGQLLILEVKANAFLHHMVRNIVGVLIEVGRRARAPGWVNEILQAKDRRSAAATAPPFGLYLVGVDYPSQFDLPQLPKGPHFMP